MQNRIRLIRVHGRFLPKYPFGIRVRSVCDMCAGGGARTGGLLEGGGLAR
jgi:hypothetical protein